MTTRKKNSTTRKNLKTKNNPKKKMPETKEDLNEMFDNDEPDVDLNEDVE
ncbi:MAG: hypothetical protein KJ592_04125 [Nanoarchaeota archaeon]|nr:hypothetical protein [Nanoarchaeota archaeon]